MSDPPRGPQVVRVSLEEQQQARLRQSEERRLSAMKDQKLEDLLEDELKLLLAKPFDKGSDKLSERTALLKVGVALLAVKHRLGPVWGSALDEESA